LRGDDGSWPRSEVDRGAGGEGSPGGVAAVESTLRRFGDAVAELAEIRIR